MQSCSFSSICFILYTYVFAETETVFSKFVKRVSRERYNFKLCSGNLYNLKIFLFRNLFSSSPIFEIAKIAGLCSDNVEERIPLGSFSIGRHWTIVANFCPGPSAFMGCRYLRVAIGKCTRCIQCVLQFSAYSR